MWAHAIAAERGLNVSMCEPDVSPIALQGPKAVNVVADVLGDWIHDLKYFWSDILVNAKMGGCRNTAVWACLELEDERS